MNQIQLRGKAGQIVATDGKQLLLQGGFQFPWDDNILVPRLPTLDLVGLGVTGPIGLARTERSLILRVGDWTFWLVIDTTSRFPTVEDAIPRTTRASRLRLDPDDAEVLRATLPRLPGRDEDFSPVTLELARTPVTRARSEKGGPATELVLTRSQVIGPEMRVVMDRRYLLRALQLGFTEIQVVRPEVPLVCRDDRRSYVWMPLDAKTAVEAGENTLRLNSVETAALSPDEPQPRRRIPMAPPSGNGHPPEDRLPPVPPDRGAGINDLISEAENVRNMLADATARLARLVSALKQHRRQTKAITDAVASLRQVKLGG